LAVVLINCHSNQRILTPTHSKSVTTDNYPNPSGQEGGTQNNPQQTREDSIADYIDTGSDTAN